MSAATEQLISLLRDFIGLTPTQELKLRELPAPAVVESTPPAPIDKPITRWTVGRTAISGQVFLCASFDRGNGMVDQQFFVGHPDRLQKFRRTSDGTWTPFVFHGSVVPAEVAAEYARRFDPANGGLPVPGIRDPGPAPDYSRCPPNSSIPAQRR